MEKLNYNFSSFERILFNIKHNPTPRLMSDLKEELNKFFKDSRCEEVIYTNNTDKMFFGMAVMPVFEGSRVYDILQNDNSFRISSYYLELDSKLFKETLGLNAGELTAVLLHEVGHMVKDAVPIQKVRANIDIYLMKNKESISISDSIHYKELLSFGIKDALRKVTSIFENDSDELIADEFVVRCGYGEQLETAFRKIVKNSYNINKDVDNKIIVLSWVLRLYKDVKLRRISAIRSLRKSKDMTSSKLEKKEIDNTIRRLERIDDDALLESTLKEIIGKYDISGTVRRFKYKGIRGFEDDLYEFNLRTKNVETEGDALLLLHQINSRMAIIDDYINTEELDEVEKKRFFTLLDKFQKVRDDLSRSTLYQNKTRIYVNYPNLTN